MSNLSGLIGFWNSKCSEGDDPVYPKRRGNVNKSNTFRHSSAFGRDLGDFNWQQIAKDNNEERKVNDLEKDAEKVFTPEVRITPPTSSCKLEDFRTVSSSVEPKKMSPKGLTRDPLPADQRVSPFEKFKKLEKDTKETMQGSRSLPSSPKLIKSSLFSRKNSLTSSRGTTPTVTHAMLSQGTSSTVSRSGSSAKEIILSWVQETLKDYPIQITNFSSCWADGLAFCALIHAFYPDVFEWKTLKASNREYNFSLGFRAAEELADITPLLDVEDMVKYTKPDWKCVFTYVQSFYRRFRHLTPEAATNSVNTETVVDDSPCDPMKELEKEEYEEEKLAPKKSIQSKSTACEPSGLCEKTGSRRFSLISPEELNQSTRQ